MNNTLHQRGFIIIFTVILLVGCGAIHEAAIKLAEISAPKENENSKQTIPPQKAEESKQVAVVKTPAKEVDLDFIPTPQLSNNNFNDLWTVATKKCNEFKWHIAKSDRATRNLICQSQSSSNKMTLKVIFADEGIYMGASMFTKEGALLAGKGLTSRTIEYREMKKTLQDKLLEIQSSKKDGTDAKPIINQQAADQKTIEKPNGSSTITSYPMAPEKRQKSIAPVTPVQEKTESSSSMTIKQIQQRLSDLGYQPGPLDGKIGTRTTEALKKFQQDNNLPVTGKSDNETVNKLRQKAAKDNREQDSSPRTPKAKAPEKAKPVKARSPIDSIL